ncbi:MAG: 50S ribosomal protein L17 [Patescibacteria group bacterium]
MRKRKKGRKLSLKTDQRKALLRSVAESLFLKEKIKTTEAKAKEVAGLVEKMITKAKKGDMAAVRSLSRFFSDRIVKKLIKEIAPRYVARMGGYTRIIKLGPRKNDASKMAIVELVK